MSSTLNSQQSHIVDPVKNRNNVLIALIITAGFMLVEVAGGIISGSLALLADAGHMLTDSMALLLSLIAFRMAERSPCAKQHYGYHRFPVLAAFTNAIAMLLIAATIIYSAVNRLLAPEPIMGNTMFTISVLGLLVNIIALKLVYNSHCLNLRGATLHVMADTLSSVAVILASIIIILTGWYPIDPLLSMLVCLPIIGSAWKLLRESAHILLEGAPKELDSELIAADLSQNIDAVSDIHELHLWSLNERFTVISLHALLHPGSDVDSTLASIQARLKLNYQIEQATVQVEFKYCKSCKRQ